MRQKTIDAIMAHAAAEYPRECCGVVAQKSRVERYFPCRNLAAAPEDNFVLCPEDYAAAEDWGTVIAIAHSHPDATTQPSELDKAQCDATLLPWHIVSWPEGDLRTIQPRGELPLLERPFVLGHFDCWGLVMSYFRQTHGIELTITGWIIPGGKTTIRTTSIRIAGMSADSVNSTGHRNPAIW
jgi:proteasome lid subunit RPN8/RPN11